MNAREYLGERLDHSDKYLIKVLIPVLEDFHTLKSQEEAEERYRKAIESVMGLIVAKPHLKDAFEGCARIAAGKEEK